MCFEFWVVGQSEGGWAHLSLTPFSACATVQSRARGKKQPRECISVFLGGDVTVTSLQGLHGEQNGAQACGTVSVLGASWWGVLRKQEWGLLG